MNTDAAVANNAAVLGGDIIDAITHCLDDTKVHGMNEKHGMTDTPEWLAWKNMRDRCYNKNSRSYPHYGGRGIQVCERWSKFTRFYEDMGGRPSKAHSLDRIDNNGDYCPENCMWANRKQQQRNRSITPKHTYKGKTLSLAGWADVTGISRKILCKRITVYGWSVERALTTEVDRGKAIEWRGEARSLPEWAKHLGMSYPTIWARIHRHGWGVDKAFTTPTEKA